MTSEPPPPADGRGPAPRVIYRWPNRTTHSAPVRDLAGVLDDVARYIRRYVVLSDTQARACTLWVAHCHAFAAAETTPYLNVTSAVKQFGKTRLLEVLEPIVPSPWLTGRVSAAVLIRKVDSETPTLLLDESDATFTHRSEHGEALRSILNSGYRRYGVSSLCVVQGAGLTYRDFSTFCPKAIAGIGALPDTLTDRSIPIALKRRAPDGSVERFRLRHAPDVDAPLLGRPGRVEENCSRGLAKRRARPAAHTGRPGRRCVGTPPRHCRPGGWQLANTRPPHADGPVGKRVDEGPHYLGRRSSSACANNAEAFRRISFARLSSRFSRSSVFSRSRSSVVRPGRRPVSRSA